MLSNYLPVFITGQSTFQEVHFYYFYFATLDVLCYLLFLFTLLLLPYNVSINQTTRLLCYTYGFHLLCSSGRETSSRRLNVMSSVAAHLAVDAAL